MSEVENERDIQKANVQFDDVERVWEVLSHITAVETGRSFFADRRPFKLWLSTTIHKSRSSQPIINIRADAGSFSPPEKIELYYPLSPTQAMLYLENSTFYR